MEIFCDECGCDNEGNKATHHYCDNCEAPLMGLKKAAVLYKTNPAFALYAEWIKKNKLYDTRERLEAFQAGGYACLAHLQGHS